jgi:hypothetical protein
MVKQQEGPDRSNRAQLLRQKPNSHWWPLIIVHLFDLEGLDVPELFCIIHDCAVGAELAHLQIEVVSNPDRVSTTENFRVP